jgi:hypothetical protein
MSEIRLYIANRDTGIRLRRDATVPTMWRIHRPDGMVSPPGNLTCAKEAALMHASPGGPVTHRWKQVAGIMTCAD